MQQPCIIGLQQGGHIAAYLESEDADVAPWSHSDCKPILQGSGLVCLATYMFQAELGANEA